jgi:hypothetical protein
MLRPAAVLCSILLLGFVGTSAADEKDDPVKVRLDKAKQVYEEEITKVEKGVYDALDKAETASRKKGDKGAVDQIKIERSTFDFTGIWPKYTPAATTKQFTAARVAMEVAYQQAIKDYTKTKHDAMATVLENELKQWKAIPVLRVRYFNIVNKNSELLLAPNKETADAGADLMQIKKSGKLHEQWSVIPIPKSDVCLLRNREGGNFASNGGSTNAGNVPSLSKDDAGDSTRWYLVREGEYFVLQSAHSKLVLGVADASKDPGARLVQWNKLDGAAEQRWSFVPVKAD